MPVQVKASLWFLICAFLQRGISGLTTPIFTRLLTTSEYGKYNVFSSWQSIITCLVTLNLFGGMYSQGLVKRDENERDSYSSSLLGLTTTMSLVWTGIYFCFCRFWNHLFSVDVFQMIMMLLIIWSSTVYNFWAVRQRVELKYKKLVGVTLATSLLNPILSIVLVTMSDDKVTARILGTAIIDVTIYILLFVSQMKNGKKYYSKHDWKYALTFCIPLIPHYLSQMVLNSSDRIMIQKLVDDSTAGIYSLAYSVSMIMTLFNSSLIQTIEPWIFQKIKEGKVENIKRVAYPSFAIIAVVNIVLIAFAPEVIKIFAPKEYYDAIWVIPPIAMSVFFMFMYSFFALFEFYFEKPQYITIATIVGALLNVILNYFCIKKFGYLAAGYTTLVCYVIYALMHYMFMKKVLKENMNDIRVYDMRIIIALTAIFMILSFGLMATYTTPIIRYIALAFMFVLIFIKKKLIFTTVRDLISVKKLK